jgi:NADH-quinone oxidoreductase subunit N
MQNFLFVPPDLDLNAILPLLVMLVTGIIALVAEMVHPKRSNDLIVLISLGGLVLAGLLTGRNLAVPESTAFAGTYKLDHFGVSVQFVIIVGTFLAIVFSDGYLREKKIPFGEIYPLMIWSALGAMMMAATTHLLVIFLGLEILSVALYVMAGLSRGEEKSNESALKYFLLGAFASGFLLYGIAFIYGGTNSLSLEAVSGAWVTHDPTKRTFLIAGLGMILVGLGFKTSLVPFHQWAPDVYQGSPTNVTSFMATVSKAGAFAALVRVLDSANLFREVWIPPLVFVAILTMTVGNLAALIQKDVKRILGYSSIAQAGYILAAIVSHEQNRSLVGSNTVSYYLFGYTLMTSGCFAVLSLTAQNGREGTRLEDLRGMWKRSPFAAIALIIFVSSLIGLPPTVGFTAKLEIFDDAIHVGLTPLAIAVAVNSIISVYYYLQIALAAITPDEAEREARPFRLNPGVIGTCVLSLVGVFGAILPPVIQVFSNK